MSCKICKHPVTVDEKFCKNCGESNTIIINNNYTPQEEEDLHQQLAIKRDIYAKATMDFDLLDHYNSYYNQYDYIKKLEQTDSTLEKRALLKIILIKNYEKPEAIYALLASNFRKTKEYEKALKYYKKEFEIRKLADIAKNIADMYILLKHYEDAKTFYDKALRLGITDPVKLSLNLGTCCAELKDYNLAIKYFNKYKTDSPKSAKVYNQIAIVKVFEKNIDSALENYKKSWKLEKAQETAYNIGELYESIENIDKAKEYYQKSLDINDRYAIAHNALLRLK